MKTERSFLSSSLNDEWETYLPLPSWVALEPLQWWVGPSALALGSAVLQCILRVSANTSLPASGGPFSAYSIAQLRQEDHVSKISVKSQDSRRGTNQRAPQLAYWTLGLLLSPLPRALAVKLPAAHQGGPIPGPQVCNRQLSSPATIHDICMRDVHRQWGEG